jgi:hypothetical protein
MFSVAHHSYISVKTCHELELWITYFLIYWHFSLVKCLDAQLAARETKGQMILWEAWKSYRICTHWCAGLAICRAGVPNSGLTQWHSHTSILITLLNNSSFSSDSPNNFDFITIIYQPVLLYNLQFFIQMSYEVYGMLLRRRRVACQVYAKVKLFP